MALAPKTEAISRSRTKPVTREARVSRETVEAALNRLTGASVARTPGLFGPASPGSHGLLQSRALLATSSNLKELNNGLWKTQEKEPAPGVGP